MMHPLSDEAPLSEHLSHYQEPVPTLSHTSTPSVLPKSIYIEFLGVIKLEKEKKTCVSGSKPNACQLVTPEPHVHAQTLNVLDVV